MVMSTAGGGCSWSRRRSVAGRRHPVFADDLGDRRHREAGKTRRLVFDGVDAIHHRVVAGRVLLIDARSGASAVQAYQPESAGWGG
jgi:hypothetical protein